MTTDSMELIPGQTKDRNEDEPRYTAFSKEVCTIYVVLFINILALGIAVVPFIAKTEYVISGKEFEVTSESAFVFATTQLINAGIKFSSSKAVSGLSDHVGRKPVLVLASIMFFFARFVIVSSASSGMLYLASFISGLADIVLPVTQAWLCDLLENRDRGKSFGILVGFGYGMGFAIGLPMGGVIAQKVSTNTALWISAILPCVNAVFILFCAVPDTYGIIDEGQLVRRHTTHARRLPPNLWKFLVQNNPLSAFALMKKADINVWDWGSYVFGQLSFKIYQTLLILFLQDIMALTQTEAGVVLCLVGLLVAVISPSLLTRYTERPLLFYGMSIQVAAYSMLSIAGIHSAGKVRNLAYPALILWCFGMVWISAMQSLLTMQYQRDQQGEVLGVIQQLGEMCVMFAYPVGVLFSYTLKRNAELQWSGVIWACSVGYLVVALFIQLYSRPKWSDLFVLVRRSHPLTFEAKSEDGAAIENKSGGERGLAAHDTAGDMELSFVSSSNPLCGVGDDAADQD